MPVATSDHLLDRSPIIAHDEPVADLIRGRRVLVTGAGGSIGSEIARQVALLDPEKLFLLDRDETLLQTVQFDIWGDGLLDSDALVLADIRDRGYLHRSFERLGVDIVFHAAALKHLTLLENHPVEAVKSNVLGTRNVISAAQAAGVKRFVNISTDKAADPTSILGASKRIAEMVVSSYEDTMCVANVRFGNVLGSRGSFLTLLKRLLREGRPVTVTDAEAERFFMTIPEAAGLVLDAASLASGNVSTFVLDMGDPVKIVDVVRRYAAEHGYDDYTMVFTGLRPGEKLREVVFAGHEDRQPTLHPRVYSTTSPHMSVTDMTLLSQLEMAAWAASEEADRQTLRLLTQLIPEYTPSFEVSAPRSVHSSTPVPAAA